MKETHTSEKYPSIRQNLSRFGYWTAVFTTVFALLALGIAITTPPRSGPFCQGDCITYPYTDAAEFVPRDYFWMYPAILLGLLFLMLVVCIHQNASDDKKIYSLLGVCFASISTAVISIDYFIQLTVMQPSFIKGEMEGLSLFSQYNPHGIFIALEDLGYLMMSLAFLFVSAIFTGKGKLERSIRWIFRISFALAIIFLIVLALYYGYDLEYRFECAIIPINWITLIVVGVLLGQFFKRVGRAA
jgi:hypothetical protein